MAIHRTHTHPPSLSPSAIEADRATAARETAYARLLQMMRGTLRRRKQAYFRVNKAQRRTQELLELMNEDTQDES